VRRGTIVRLVAVGLAAGAAVLLVALFVPWLPPVASKERERIDLVFWVTTGICIFVFAIVAGVSVYAVWKFRARPDDESDGPPIHGHTGLEIAWTAVPVVLVITIAVVSAVALAKNGSYPSNTLQVNVTARQFAWTFQYPSYHNLTSSVLRLPVDRPVRLNLTSQDVIHSFWVKEFGQKQDALPYPAVTHVKITPTKVTPTKSDWYPVVCTELCGLGHAYMRSWAVVMTQAGFDRWAKGQGGQQAGGGGSAGASLFKTNGCGSCHTFKAANATGTIGPDLDKLPQYAKQAGKPLGLFVSQSITDPNAYVQKGYKPNVMPHFNFSSQQVAALVQYLTGKGS
jgi:cytochrome c oxidase subunit II